MNRETVNGITAIERAKRQIAVLFNTDNTIAQLVRQAPSISISERPTGNLLTLNTSDCPMPFPYLHINLRQFFDETFTWLVTIKLGQQPFEQAGDLRITYEGIPRHQSTQLVIGACGLFKDIALDFEDEDSGFELRKYTQGLSVKRNFPLANLSDQDFSHTLQRIQKHDPFMFTALELDRHNRTFAVSFHGAPKADDHYAMVLPSIVRAQLYK